MTLGLTEDACPVSLETVGSLYRAEPDAFPDFVEVIPEATRARLAIYLYGHGHTRELGLRVAATCAANSLKYAAGRLGEAIYLLSRQFERTAAYRNTPGNPEGVPIWPFAASRKGR